MASDSKPYRHDGDPFSVLVFSKTAPGGYRHASIPAAVESLKGIAARSGRFVVHATEEDEAITGAALERHAAVVFLHNIDDFLSPAQLQALKDYVRSGRGFVGIHSAAAGMLTNEWYGRLVGAHFDFHPAAQWGDIVVEDVGHYIMAGAPGDAAVVRKRRWNDEWYNFKTNPRGNVHVLMSVEEGSYSGGKGDDHPLAWTQEFESARCFYTSLGHFEEAFEDEWFAGQLERAILWVAKADEAS